MTSIEFLNKVYEARGNTQRSDEKLGALMPFEGTPAQGLPTVKGGKIFALITLSTEANGQLAKMCDGWYKAVTGIDDFLSHRGVDETRPTPLQPPPAPPGASGGASLTRPCTRGCWSTALGAAATAGSA